MLTDHGLRRFLAALSSLNLKARFVVGGQKLDQGFPVVYAKTDDDDPANTGRGANVLTWKIVVPAGQPWGSTPAEAVELFDPEGAIYKTTLDYPFQVSRTHPSVLFINVNIRKLT